MERSGFVTVLDYELDSTVREFLARPHRMLINGEWVEAASGQTFETHDPATGDPIGDVPFGEVEDIDRAVAAARAAFDDGPWQKITPMERGRLITRLGDLILDNAEEL